MADVFTQEKRSEIMSKIKNKNTAPELTMKRLLRKSGVAFNAHPEGVFGSPDIINRRKKVAIFLDGCFWHGCKKCRTIPKANRKFWKSKIEYNKNRRRTVKRQLAKEGWKVLEFWEHEINKNSEKVAERIVRELKSRI